MSDQGGGPRIRPLAPGEEHAFRLLRLLAAEWMPYFGRALFAVQPVAAPGLRTFAVDAHWRLYMDPGLLAGPSAWPIRLGAAVALHEIMHLVREHAGRTEPLPAPVHPLAWNLATDAEINDGLLAGGVPLPAGAVTPGSLSLPDDLLAEDYYAHLVPQALAGQLDRFDDGGPGCGSGSGGPAAPGEVPWDPASGLPGQASWDEAAGLPGLGPAGGDLVRRVIAQDIKAAAGRGRGSVPAGLDRWADATLAAPTLPWQQVLRGAVRATIAAAAAGRADYTYLRPSRRRVPGVIRPAMRGVLISAAVIVDTSGSMGEAQLNAALSEIGGVLSASGISRDHLHVLACDAAAAAPQLVRSLSDVRLTGGGGTDMRVGIDAAMRLRPAPDVSIVLTDGDTPWPEQPTRVPLVCAVISPSPPAGTPPWALTVHVPDGPARGRPPVPEMA